MKTHEKKNYSTQETKNGQFSNNFSFSFLNYLNKKKKLSNRKFAA